MLINCDNCPGIFETHSTTRATCPYCGKSVEIREEVVNTNPDAKAGYFKTDPYVDRLIKQGVVKELK